MNDYIPETFEVRNAYAVTLGNQYITSEGAKEQFDRWLASVKAEAWEQGVKYALGHDLDADFWTAPNA